MSTVVHVVINIIDYFIVTRHYAKHMETVVTLVYYVEVYVQVPELSEPRYADDSYRVLTYQQVALSNDVIADVIVNFIVMIVVELIALPNTQTVMVNLTWRGNVNVSNCMLPGGMN